MPTDDGKRLSITLLTGAALAVALVAALAAAAASLGGGAWLPVLAPFALVLLVPVVALAWLHVADTDELPETPATQHPVTLPEGRRPAPPASRKAA